MCASLCSACVLPNVARACVFVSLKTTENNQEEKLLPFTITSQKRKKNTFPPPKPETVWTPYLFSLTQPEFRSLRRRPWGSLRQGKRLRFTDRPTFCQIVCRLLYPSVHIRPSVHPSVPSPVRPFTRPSDHLCIRQTVHPCIRPSVHPCIPQCKRVRFTVPASYHHFVI